jgi:hypothetical protein
MKYKLELNFTDTPKCSSCMLSGVRGLDLEGETVMACFALGIRPKCPEDGCRRDCPLKQDNGGCIYESISVQ